MNLSIFGEMGKSEWCFFQAERALRSYYICIKVYVVLCTSFLMFCVGFSKIFQRTGEQQNVLQKLYARTYFETRCWSGELLIIIRWQLLRANEETINVLLGQAERCRAGRASWTDGLFITMYGTLNLVLRFFESK